jgi:hypothetical protein
MSTLPTERSRFGKIPQAVAYAGVSRATLYNWAPKFPGLFRKSGTSTLIDYAVLDRILDELPVAKIKPLKPRA